MVCFPPHPFKCLAPNLSGTDFFVGDVHGHFERLGHALEEAEFDPARDRLISVGDLIDRGPSSEMAAVWLEQPFFYAVRGNHEELYLRWRSLRNHRAAQAAFEKKTYFKNGGRWVQEATETEHRRLESVLQDLPYFLAVPTPEGRTVGVVHAELPDGTSWPKLLQMQHDDELFQSMLWGQDRWRRGAAQWRPRPKRRFASRPSSLPPPATFADGHLIAGLDAVVCGHRRVPKGFCLGNLVYLDTAGWSSTGYFSVVSAAQALALADRASPTVSSIGVEPLLP